MAEAKSVPVLFLSESIVLPGMVVPIELDDAARAAVDAARASEAGELLIAPRLEDRYPSYGVLASIVQVGRVAGGSAAGGGLRRRAAAAIAPAPQQAATDWGRSEPAPTTPAATEETRGLAAEYK